MGDAAFLEALRVLSLGPCPRSEGIVARVPRELHTLDCPCAPCVTDRATLADLDLLVHERIHGIDKRIALTLGYRQEIYHTVERNSRGTPVRAFINGACKTWKTRPYDFRIPWKHGMYGPCGYIQVITRVAPVSGGAVGLWGTYREDLTLRDWRTDPDEAVSAGYCSCDNIVMFVDKARGAMSRPSQELAGHVKLWTLDHGGAEDDRCRVPGHFDDTMRLIELLNAQLTKGAGHVQARQG